MLAMRWRGNSTPVIGRALNLDHSTVLYGLSQAAKHAAVIEAAHKINAAPAPPARDWLKVAA